MRLLFFLLLFNLDITAQETFSKTIFQGGYVIVPSSEIWKLDEVFVSGGGVYNFKVSNSNFKSHYNSGDTLRAPFYLPELNFLENPSSAQFIFKFTKIK